MKYVIMILLALIIIGCSKSTKETITCNIQTINHPLYGNIRINDSVKMGDEEFVFIKKMGQPDSIYKEYNEIFDVNTDVLKYDNSSFYFEGSTLNGFELNDDKFFLQIDELKFKINDRECRDSTYRKQIQDYDQYLIFEVKNGKILKIYTWEAG
jgi:major membrane immunogen (membrane-anchored lipoprotein)